MNETCPRCGIEVRRDPDECLWNYFCDGVDRDGECINTLAAKR